MTLLIDILSIRHLKILCRKFTLDVRRDLPVLKVLSSLSFERNRVYWIIWMIHFKCDH